MQQMNPSSVTPPPFSYTTQSFIHHIMSNVHLTNPVKGRPSTTRKIQSKPSVKGDRSDIPSFLSCHDSEPKVAAYLGYQDMAEFRKCLFSFHVIEFFNVYAKHCSGRSAKVALELIRDLPNPEALFRPSPITKRLNPKVATSREIWNSVVICLYVRVYMEDAHVTHVEPEDTIATMSWIVASESVGTANMMGWEAISWGRQSKYITQKVLTHFRDLPNDFGFIGSKSPSNRTSNCLLVCCPCSTSFASVSSSSKVVQP